MPSVIMEVMMVNPSAPQSIPNANPSSTTVADNAATNGSATPFRTECPVCGYEINDKHCLHYGGISCYSCRAFFRRAHQNTKTPNFKCKNNNNCEVSVKTRRKCQKCRYDKCINKAGMDPLLVLNEEQKQIRFRNFLKKKALQDQAKHEEATTDHNSSSSSSYEDHFKWNRNQQIKAEPLILESRPMNRSTFQRMPVPGAHYFGTRGNSKEPSSLPVLAVVSGNYPASGIGQKREREYVESIKAHAANVTSANTPVWYENYEQKQNVTNWSHPPPSKMIKSSDYYYPSSEAPINLKKEEEDSDRSLSPNSLSLDEYVELLKQRYFLTMAQMVTPPKFIESLQAFHSGKTNALQRLDFSEHMFRLAIFFRNFAQEQTTFKELQINDQELLLERNTALFVMYMLGSYLGSNQGEEQLQWLLNENMPQNLSYSKQENVSFKEFNRRVGFFRDDDQDLFSDFEKCIHNVAEIGLDYHSTGIVANMFLFSSNPFLEQQGLSHPSKIKANFIRALELVRHSHEQIGRNVETEDLLKLVITMDKMKNIYNQVIDLPYTYNDLPFLDIKLPVTMEEDLWLAKELEWFQSIWNTFEDTIVDTQFLEEILAFNRQPVEEAPPQSLLPKTVQLFLARLRRIALTHTAFKALSIQSQNEMWRRNCSACLLLCSIKFLFTCNGPHEQASFIKAPESDGQFLPLSRWIDLIHWNKANGEVLSEQDLGQYMAAADTVSDLVRTDVDFKLMLMSVLFSNDKDDGNINERSDLVSNQYHFYVKLLRRRTSLKKDSMVIEEAVKAVHKASQVISKMGNF